MLITLWDMKELAAAKMVHITTSIDYLEKAAWFHSPELGKWSAAEAQKVKTGLNGILEDLEFLSLGTTKAQCQRLVSEINTLNVRSLADRGAALRQTLNDELGSMAFLLIAPNELHYYTSTTLLGESTASRLRTANDEISEAGKCFALERDTACVYHLMRALESALQLLAKRLGVKRKSNWQQYLVGIEDVLKQRYTPRSKNRIFYSECAAQLSHVKNAWRNPTMHIEKIYTHKHTEDIFNAVKALLRQFATKLKEPQPKAVHF